jgi:hypothetical protein
MQNERELLIDELLARRQEAERPAPGWPMSQPGCPGITDLMDVALDRATPWTGRPRRLPSASGITC